MRGTAKAGPDGVALDVANPFFTGVVRGAEEIADERDVMVVVCNTGEDLTCERRHPPSPYTATRH